MQRGILGCALGGLFAVAVAAFLARGGLQGDGLRYAAGALLGGFAGIGLYHASFGFTGAWRRLVRERRGAGLRAQLLLLGVVSLFTFPLIGWEDVTGWNMHPVVVSMGLASAIGAFIFGIGMQLGGGCASGTLFTAGGGSTRMIVVLAFFIAGSVIATAHIPSFWNQLDDMTGVPNLPPVSLVSAFGPLGGLMLLAVLLGTIWFISVRLERTRHGSLEAGRETADWFTGPWSLIAGAMALAIVSVLTFVLFQRPWGVTAGFALWGAKIGEGLGFGVGEWTYWQGWRAAQLEASVFANRTSVMNFGIIFGAMAAAALAGRFAPVWHLSRRDLLTAVIGGLLMGYGARLAYGCNIGAFLGGIVSGSLHGWWWLVFGFAGSTVGTWLRGVLYIDPPIAIRPAN